MNQQAIYRSIWTNDTIETNCEVTPEGEIVNVEMVDPPNDLEHLVSEEVELVSRSKSYNIVYDEDNNPLIEDADTSVRFQALLLDGIFFPSTAGLVSFSGYGVYDGLTESWVESNSQPGKPYTSSADIGSSDPSGVYAFTDSVVLSTYSRLDSVGSTVLNAFTATNYTMFSNHYTCPSCRASWKDAGDSMCDSECGECGLRHVTPTNSKVSYHSAKLSIPYDSVQGYLRYTGIKGGIPGVNERDCVYHAAVDFPAEGYLADMQIINSTDGVICQGILFKRDGDLLTERVAIATFTDRLGDGCLAGKWIFTTPEGLSFILDVDVIEPEAIVLDAFGIQITLTEDGGGAITSTLKEGDDRYDHVIDGIESMILAHAIAGIDVNSPAYLEGIETAVLSAANNLPDEDTEMKTITLSDFSSSDSAAFTEVISEKLSDMDIEYSSFSYCIDVDVLLATS